MIVTAALFATILPTGTYRYETSIAGHSVGASTIVVQKNGNVTTIGESASLMGSALIAERKIDETNFATISYAVDYQGRHVLVSLVGNVATLNAGGATTKISTAADAPFVVNDNMVAGFAQIPATLHATGAKKLTFACVCGGFIAVPVTLTATRDGSATIEIDGATAALTYDPATFVLERFEMPSQQLTVVLKSSDARIETLPTPIVATPVPLPPARYESRDVSIRADDGVTLAGTLSIPKSAVPLPGFVFVHGSGCLDRDETIGPNKIFEQLGNRLANDGYAVLRYDKRSCGRSGGTFAVRNRLIADARDAIAYLRAQPGIDPGRIFVLGHSEGGELAPSIAVADRRLRGIVLLAPPALPLDAILMQQLLRNTPAAERAAQEKKIDAQLGAISAGKSKGAYAAWLRSSFGIDPVTIIAKVPCPILMLQGTKDIQVLPGDLPRLVKAGNAAHRNVTVRLLQDDDHLFIKLPAGEPSTGGEYFTPAYVDDAVFEAIEGWLHSLRPR